MEDTRMEGAIYKLEGLQSMCVGLSISEMYEKSDQDIFGLIADVLKEAVEVVKYNYEDLMANIQTAKLEANERGEIELLEKVKQLLDDKLTNNPDVSS